MSRLDFVDIYRFEIIRDIYSDLIVNEVIRATMEARREDDKYGVGHLQGDDDDDREQPVMMRMGMQADVAIDAADVLLVKLGLKDVEDAIRDIEDRGNGEVM